MGKLFCESAFRPPDYGSFTGLAATIRKKALAEAATDASAQATAECPLCHMRTFRKMQFLMRRLDGEGLALASPWYAE